MVQVSSLESTKSKLESTVDKNALHESTPLEISAHDVTIGSEEEDEHEEEQEVWTREKRKSKNISNCYVVVVMDETSNEVYINPFVDQVGRHAWQERI